MKKLKLLFFSFVFICGIPAGTTQAQTHMSVTGQIFAEIISGFTVTETTQLNFGRFSPGPGGGQIILTPQGTLSTIGSVVLGGGMHNVASFYITGNENATYSITLPTGITNINHTSNSQTMLITDWISLPAPGVGAGLLKGGSQLVKIGATLIVSTINNNPSGIYTGSYTITFDFN